MAIQQTLVYGDATIMESGIGILEGTNAFILIATDYFETYKRSTGALLDEFVLITV
jgi:hypothetical protein